MFFQSKAGFEAVEFYRDQRTDHCGRSRVEILKQSYDWLESKHDFIQWIFPLKEPSAANPHAPILSEAAVREFQKDPALKERLVISLKIMLGFYGLELVESGSGSVTVKRLQNFAQRSRCWLTPWNHNFLRITRILKSLSILGLPDHARGFLQCLEGIYPEYRDVISENTFAFWQAAVQEA